MCRGFECRRAGRSRFWHRNFNWRGWGISTGSLGKLEAQLRRVPDCELMFLAQVLEVSISDLFPLAAALKEVGPQFQAGHRLAVFPTRAQV